MLALLNSLKCLKLFSFLFSVHIMYILGTVTEVLLYFTEDFNSFCCGDHRQLGRYFSTLQNRSILLVLARLSLSDVMMHHV